MTWIVSSLYNDEVRSHDGSSTRDADLHRVRRAVNSVRLTSSAASLHIIAWNATRYEFDQYWCRLFSYTLQNHQSQ